MAEWNKLLIFAAETVIKWKIMAQVSMTVRMDAGIKAQFEELCSQFGMSVNTAMNVFANAVVRKRKIPFEITAKPSEDDVLNDFYAFRREVAASDRPELTMEEINEEIRLAREEMSRKKKASVWFMQLSTQMLSCRHTLRRTCWHLRQKYGPLSWGKWQGDRFLSHSESDNIEIESFRFNKSKPIIDEIDKVLAKHYGFTEEELDFIINYDIKYRMGDELGEQ